MVQITYCKNSAREQIAGAISLAVSSTVAHFKSWIQVTLKIDHTIFSPLHFAPTNPNMTPMIQLSPQVPRVELNKP
jgi:hypothetical protein